MSENKPWWKRFALWIFAGVSGLVLFVLANQRKPPPPPPMPSRPPLEPVTLPPGSTTPHGDYTGGKVEPAPPGKTGVKKIIRRLRSLGSKE